MNDERYDSIDYDAGWQTTQTVSAEPVKARLYRSADDFSDEEDEDDVYVTRRRKRYEDDDREFEEREKKSKAKPPKSGTQVLIKYQLIICIIAAIAAFALKSFGGQIYEMVDSWYTAQINSSLVVEAGNFF